MSNPSNILSSFRSYSYHQVLLVCDSTQTAELLSSSITVSDFEHNPYTNKYSPRSVSGGTGSYVVMINSMTDINFIINSSNWETIIAPGSKTSDGMSLASTIELDGQMEIVEPNGVAFLDNLSMISDSLGSDPNGLVFMLKTIFVGFEDDGVTTTVIPTVRPLLFAPYDITAIFDQSGAKYTFTFVGISNGVGKTAPLTSIGGGQNLDIIKDEPLSAAIARYNGVIDATYILFKKALQLRFDKAGMNINVDTDFRLVKYQFKLIGYDGSYIAGDNENIRIANKDGDPVLSFNNSLGIEEALTKIMESSKQVVNDKPKFIFKITSKVESTPDEYVVTYEIHKYELKTVQYETDPAAVGPGPGQAIEFDYVFTGKNIDIIELDIKMDLGMAFFQTLASAQNYPSQGSAQGGTIQVAASGLGGIVRTAKTNKLRDKSPLYLGSTLGDDLIRNKKNPVNIMGFQTMLHRHAAIENIQAAMTIHGNPQLMDEMLPTISEITAEQTESPKENQTINPNWLAIPTLVKINIRMPVDANNIKAGFKPFWYEGYYSLFAVNNIFNNGKFTQKLDMFSLPVVEGTIELTDEDKDKVEIVGGSASGGSSSGSSGGSSAIVGEELTPQNRIDNVKTKRKAT